MDDSNIQEYHLKLEIKRVGQITKNALGGKKPCIRPLTVHGNA